MFGLACSARARDSCLNVNTLKLTPSMRHERFTAASSAKLAALLFHYCARRLARLSPTHVSVRFAGFLEVCRRSGASGSGHAGDEEFLLKRASAQQKRWSPEVNIHHAVDANTHRGVELLDILNMAAGFSRADLRRGSA